MEEFLNKLYSYEYFGTYLMIAIAVLLLLFIIILFFGKKDQKKREIEATKKLQQVNSTPVNNTPAFQETSVPNPVEVATPVENLNVTPNVNDMPVIENLEVPNPPTQDLPQMGINEFISNSNNEIVDKTPEAPVIEPVQPTQDVTIPLVDIAVPPVEDIKPVEPEIKVPDITMSVNNEEVSTPMVTLDPLPDNTEEIADTPLLTKEEEKPFAFTEESFNETFTMPEVNNEVISNIDVPDFNIDEIMASTNESVQEPVTINKAPEVFSSVYAPEKPIKEEIVSKEEETKVPSSEELDIELPTLKKDVVEDTKEIETPILKDYNLDDLQGETYNIN